MTKPLFRVHEILDMAIQIEHRGLAYYKACKNKQLGHEIESVLDFLIAQENRHIRVFTQMKKGLEEYRLPESYAGEMASYLDAFVKDKVFADPEKASEEIAQIGGPLQAVEWGVAFEKRSIDFYRGIQGIVRNSEREAVEAIISEEENHIRKLSQVAAELKGDG